MVMQLLPYDCRVVLDYMEFVRSTVVDSTRLSLLYYRRGLTLYSTVDMTLVR